jgi:PKD repeat protein
MPDGGIVMMGGTDDLFNKFGDVWRLQPAGSLLRNPSHVYAKPGNYTVTLQAFSSAGFSSLQKVNYIWAKRPVPTFTSITPSGPWIRNSTVDFTITGTKFQPGETTISFQNRSGVLLNGTTGAVLTSVTTTRINGTIHIPPDASTVTPYDLIITTIDGGPFNRTAAITVGPQPAPVIGTFSPASGTLNSTPVFTLTGANFQTGPGQTRVRVYEDVADTGLDLTITSLTTTKITGSINITNHAFPGAYILEVTTVDGGRAARPAAFTVGYAAIPTISSIIPIAGYRNTTVGFTISGTNFQPGKTVVAFKNQTTNLILNTTELTAVTSTKIIGNITIPNNAPAGLYRLDITTLDGGVVNKVNAFRVDTVPMPAITSITPTSGTKNSVVAFTIAGTNFQTDGRTSVRILDDVSATQLATMLYSVVPAKIVGSVAIPSTVPAGKYRLEVTTADGGTVSKYEAFTVNYMPLPTITSITPASGFQNSTVPFTLIGKDFLDGGTVVRLRTTGSTLNATLTSVNTTTILGSFTIPAGTPAGPYRLDVITNGGGFSSRINAFTVNTNPRPTISSIVPASGTRGATIAFTLTGTNFRANMTTMRFQNQSANLSIAGEPGAAVEMIPTIHGVTPTQIIGSVAIPSNATLNLWIINVTTVNGGEVSKASAFTVR